MKKLVTLSMVLFVIGIGFAAFVNAGKEDLVGTKVVNDMKIELYMEAPKQGMVMTSGKPMMMEGTPTHHAEVKVFDPASGRFIPYLDVVLHFENQSTGEKLRLLPLPAMLGGWFHYGRNATLPGKGTYKVTVDVTPQELMRYKRMAKKWAAPASITLTYNWK